LNTNNDSMIYKVTEKVQPQSTSFIPIFLLVITCTSR
jgi:hypothetical protein